MDYDPAIKYEIISLNNHFHSFFIDFSIVQNKVLPITKHIANHVSWALVLRRLSILSSKSQCRIINCP